MPTDTKTPEPIQARLFREGEDRHVYVILDGAQNENLLDVFDDHQELERECLWFGRLEPDMQEVAPYLVELDEDAPFTRWVLDHGWAQNWGIFVVSDEDLATVWRHLRQHTRIFDPQNRRLYFRYYDPRVLHAFLPTCDGKQLSEFFGPVASFIAEVEGGAGGVAYALANGELVTERIGTGSAAAGDTTGAVRR